MKRKAGCCGRSSLRPPPWATGFGENPSAAIETFSARAKRGLASGAAIFAVVWAVFLTDTDQGFASVLVDRQGRACVAAPKLGCRAIAGHPAERQEGFGKTASLRFCAAHRASARVDEFFPSDVKALRTSPDCSKRRRPEPHGERLRPPVQSLGNSPWPLGGDCRAGTALPIGRRLKDNGAGTPAFSPWLIAEAVPLGVSAKFRG